MTRAFFLTLILTSPLLFTGCKDAPNDALAVRLSDMPHETVMRDNEWRRAWKFPSGSPQRITLPVPAGAELLRLGVLPRGVVGAPVKAVVYLDDREIFRFEADNPMAWEDRRIALAPGDKDRVCSVVLESSREFWLGPCEFLPQNTAMPKVLFVLIDTLRQDHLGCYGYPRATSPAIDALAADGHRFNTLVPQSSWTRPSVASLLTACYPGTHGAIDRDTPMRPGMPSLADNLRRAGYESHALIMNPTCLPTWNIGVDFDRLLDLVGPSPSRVDDAVGVDAAIDTIASAEGRPWFLYLHLMGPHDPYVPPPPYDTRFQGGGSYPPETQALVDQYDGEIAYTDAQIARLVAALKARGEYDDTLIVLLSDHGEQFGEHGAVGHGHSLHAEELRVPFIVKLPQQDLAGTVHDALVQTVDIAPTLLAMLGVPPDADFQGTSFAPLLQGTAMEARKGYAALHLGKASMDMARNAERKLIRDQAANTRRVYDLTRDPEERHPLDDAHAVNEALRAHASRIAALGAVGWNLLVTAGDENPEGLEVVLRGDALGEIDVEYFEDCVAINRSDDAITVTLNFSRCHENLIGAGTWFGAVEQDSARLRLSAPANAEISVTLRHKGQRVPDALFSGASHTPQPAGVPIAGDRVLANPRDFDPVLLPRALAAYLWYTPAPARIADDALDPEMLQQLDALGYIR